MSTLRVLRIYHSGVVPSWRQREHCLRAADVDVSLVSARSWNEGGSRVDLADVDPFVLGARTIGSHPYLFVYDPRPIWRALRSGDIDVLDIHEEPASAATAEVLLLARLRGLSRGPRRARICLYSAQNLPKRYPIPFRWIERWALRRADAIHTCNDDVGHILRAKGYSGIIRNLGLGVDTATFTPPTASSSHDGPFRIGYVGRLEPHKGVWVLIDAVAGLDDATLDIIGDGSERDALEQMVRDRDLGDRITFHGYERHESLGDTYRRFDVLVIPSIETATWIEQFGRVAVEAMASGVPVVASDSGSLAEVLGDSGVLVPQGDVDELRDALHGLQDDPVLRSVLAEKGLARAAYFSWSSVAGRQREFYEEMVR
jgi:glycosyltransferase involved in cell wall biosynthesis